MMTIGIMGFGRIGRNLFRLLYKRDDVRIGAVCDIADGARYERTGSLRSRRDSH